jgi:hypothetical protein
MLPMNYLFVVMMLYFSNQEGLIDIHSRVENHLEIRLMEDDLIKTHLEDYCLIHTLDFMDGWHMIQECSFHHGTH